MAGAGDVDVPITCGEEFCGDGLVGLDHGQTDGSAMTEYFKPLDAWLTEQNRGETCGW